VAGNLVPLDVVPAGLGENPLPEITIGDRLLLAVLPAVLLPALPPALAKAVHDVGAVGVDVHVPAARNGGEPFGDGLKLHALVGRVGRAARDHALLVVGGDDGGPAARSRVTGAGSVRVDRHVGVSAPGGGAGGASRQADSCQ